MTEIEAILDRARSAERVLARSSRTQRDDALRAVAAAIESRSENILSANAEDLADARAHNMAPAMLDRLALNPARLHAVIRAVDEVRTLPDPLGEIREMATRPNQLKISRRRIPLGVIAVIYEARPNVTVEAATLAIKSGNAMVLRGGKEAMRSNGAFADAIRAGLTDAGLPPDAVMFVRDPSRERVIELLGASGRVDLVIPRGGADLMKLVDANAKVPVIRHGQGICHLFLDATADPVMAIEIAYNSKVHRPGVCNALETLLVHRGLLATGIFRRVADHLVRDGGVELRVDDSAAGVLKNTPFRAVEPQDWDTEFLSLILAVRVVDSLDEALEHISKHGTHHTASIVTNDAANAERFLHEVDASCVLWNASTRFNDGGELGLGSEIGTSTSKMHAFGPMGLRELTAEKFVVQGNGQVRG